MESFIVTYQKWTSGERATTTQTYRVEVDAVDANAARMAFASNLASDMSRSRTTSAEVVRVRPRYVGAA